MNKNWQMVSLTGTAKKLEDTKKWIDRIFEENPSMNDVYPGDARYILDPFAIESGNLEFFDLGTSPIHRESFTFGDSRPVEKGFFITDRCIGCGTCQANCPQQCIEEGTPFVIRQDSCLHCGLCFENCPVEAIAIVFGSIVGILISEYQKSAKWTLGVINFIYTIPSISMLGFLIPFSGVGNATATIALTIYALLPMVRAVHTGLTNVDPAIVEAAKGMGSTRTQILFKVKLPLAMPFIMSGIRNMVTMTIALAGIASFIGAGGLGVAIYRGITTNNAAMTITGSLLTAGLALLADLVLGIVEKRMQKHSKKAKRQNRAVGITVLILAGCLITGAAASAHRSSKTIHIATKPMTEQYILGEMLDILIEQDTDINVNLTQGVGGGTSNIEPAMENGEFDLYPEYTGTAWNMVLKKDDVYTEDEFSEMQSEYQDMGMTWTCMYGVCLTRTG